MKARFSFDFELTKPGCEETLLEAKKELEALEETVRNDLLVHSPSIKLIDTQVRSIPHKHFAELKA